MTLLSPSQVAPGQGRDGRAREPVQASAEEAEKLAAIGRMSSDIAHEFNNLLHVINMNLELISVLACEEKARPAVERARNAARFGAKLTRELLSFTRGASAPTGPAHVNEILLGMHELLRLSAGSGIAVELELCEGPTAAAVDPALLELKLLSLADSARDALPEGGILKIKTCVRPPPRSESPAWTSEDVVVSVNRWGPGGVTGVELVFASSRGG